MEHESYVKIKAYRIRNDGWNYCNEENTYN